MIHIEPVLLAASILLLLSILASKVAARLGVPALLLFLALGMLAGSDGPGGIYFDDASLAQSLGVVALALILFSGGLETAWSSVRPVFVKGLALSTFGVFITALCVGLFAHLVFGFTMLEGILLGAIVSATDAAAVFSVLKAHSVGLKGEVRPLLEFESGSNDPMAVFFTIGLTGVLRDSNNSLPGLVPMFFQQMLLGALLGYAMGKVTVFIINRLALEYEGLYPVLALTLALFAYGGTAELGGNGFLAVYIAGLVLGNSDFIHKRSVIHFSDGLAWLMQIAMFLTLGLLVFPSRLIPIAGLGLLVSLFLIFVARPLSVFITLAFSKMRFNEKAMVSWVGLRGAVPIILATFPLLAGLPKADMIFNLVFFIVLTSILLQGTSIPLVAKWLKIDEPAHRGPRYPLEFDRVAGMTSELVNVEIPHGSLAAGKQIVQVGFPKKALIVLISRNDEFIVPRGGTALEAGDTLLVLADKTDLDTTRSIIGADS
jgi:cell volume regulation protein A